MSTTEKIAVITDSCADVPKELAEKHRLFVLPMRIICEDGEYRDGVDIHAALQAARYIEAGVGFEELKQKIERLIAGTKVFFFIDTLEFSIWTDMDLVAILLIFYREGGCLCPM